MTAPARPANWLQTFHDVRDKALNQLSEIDDYTYALKMLGIPAGAEIDDAVDQVRQLIGTMDAIVGGHINEEAQRAFQNTWGTLAELARSVGQPLDEQPTPPLIPPPQED